MDRNICCPTSPNIPKGIWDLIRKLPTLRYMLPPVLNKEELYSKYSYRDLEPNNFAYVVDENTFYVWSECEEHYEHYIWKPITAQINTDNLKTNEDLDFDENNKLKFSDKEYDDKSNSGLGRVYLRKNIVGGKNILTQEMIEKPNTRYIIQYDYSLENKIITLPENSVLEFVGGSFKDGKFTGNTKVINISNDIIFYNILFQHSLNYVNTGWFNINYEGKVDSSVELNNAIQSLAKNDSKLEFKSGIYLHGDGETTAIEYYPLKLLPDGKYRPDVKDSSIQGTGRNIILEFKDFNTLIIEGNNSTIISHEKNAEVYNNHILDIRNTNNIVISNLIIDGNKNKRKPKLSDWTIGYINVRDNIFIEDIDNIFINNVISNNSVMDGLFLHKNINNCFISNCRFNNNYRQGITIGNDITNIKIINTECSYTGKDFGTAPMAGIDIEANASANTIKSSITNCVFRFNMGYAVDMAIGAKEAVIDSCIIENNEAIGGNTGFSNSYNNTIKNCYIKNTPARLNIPGFTFVNNYCEYDNTYNSHGILSSILTRFNYSELEKEVLLNDTVISNNVFINKDILSNNTGKIECWGHEDFKSNLIFTNNFMSHMNSDNSVRPFKLMNYSSVILNNNSFYTPKKNNYSVLQIEVDKIVENNNNNNNYLSVTFQKLLPSTVLNSNDVNRMEEWDEKLSIPHFDKKEGKLNFWNGKEWLDANGKTIYNKKVDDLPTLKDTDELALIINGKTSSINFWTGYKWIDSKGMIPEKYKGTVDELPTIRDWENGRQFFMLDDEIPVWLSNGFWLNANGYPRMFKKYGEGKDRPAKGYLEVKEKFIGYVFFDTDLNSPIWWDGKKWVAANEVEIKQLKDSIELLKKEIDELKK